MATTSPLSSRIAPGNRETGCADSKSWRWQLDGINLLQQQHEYIILIQQTNIRSKQK